MTIIKEAFKGSIRLYFIIPEETDSPGHCLIPKGNSGYFKAIEGGHLRHYCYSQLGTDKGGHRITVINFRKYPGVYVVFLKKGNSLLEKIRSLLIIMNISFLKSSMVTARDLLKDDFYARLDRAPVRIWV